MVDTASAPTIVMAGTNTSSAPITATDTPMRTGIAATTTEAIPTTDTRRVITTDPLTMAGLITHGRRRFTTTGVGAERPGMAITEPTISPIPCIRTPRFG